MNKKRREQLSKAIGYLEKARLALGPALDAAGDNTLDGDVGALAEFTGARDSARKILEDCRDEEQEYLDNMPEAMAESEKGEAVQNAIEKMEEVISWLEEMNPDSDEVADLDSNLEDAIDCINEASA